MKQIYIDTTSKIHYELLSELETAPIRIDESVNSKILVYCLLHQFNNTITQKPPPPLLPEKIYINK